MRPAVLPLSVALLVAAVAVLCALPLPMLNRLIPTLASSPLVGRVYTAYHRALTSMSSSSSSAHTVFPPNSSTFSHGSFTVQPLPILGDNYAYLLTDVASSHAALIDPADPPSILPHLPSSLTLTHVLCTHKHWDHSQGNAAVKAAFPSVSVVGSSIDAVPACTHPVEHSATLTLGQRTRVTVLHTPCHTRGHVVYHVQTVDSNDPGAVFTGDTLFIAGAGKFFEGSAAEMYHNLHDTISALPDATAVYCGHEYTQSNLEFAAWVEPSNAEVREKLKWAEERRKERLSTLATTVGRRSASTPSCAWGRGRWRSA